MNRNMWWLKALLVAFALLGQVGCQAKARQLEPGAALDKQTDEQAVAEPNEIGPRIKFEKVVCNVGDVAPGSTNVCEFKFTNVGDALLRIGKIRSTCGCTVPKLKTGDYQPGESGVIKVIYRAQKRVGPTKKHLFVPSNDKTSPKVKLTIKAKIVKKIECKPEKIEFLLKSAEVSCPEITIRSLDNKAFAVTAFKSTGDSITADVDDSIKATQFVLKPKVDIEKLQRRPNGSIQISLTHPDGRTATVRFSTVAKFKVTAQSIVLFNTQPGKPVTREAWILNNYNEDFEIESTSSRKGCTKVLSQEKIGNRYKLSLEVTPPEKTGKQTLFTDILAINIKNDTKLEINIRGFYARSIKAR